MKVIWSANALERLAEIHAHIAKDSPQVADELVDRLTNTSREIGHLPLAGRSVPEFARPEFRERLVRPFRIIYYVGKDRIEVLSVLHYRQLIPEALGS